MEFALQLEGHDVFTTATQLEAMMRLPELQPEVVILAIDGAGSTDLGFLSTLGAHSEAVIIAVSERTDRAIRVQALRAGADHVVVKPFYGDELCARVEAALRRGSRKSSSTDKQQLNVTAEAALPPPNDGVAHISGGAQPPRPRYEMKTIGRIRLDPARRVAFIAGHEISFTESEFNVFEALVLANGHIAFKTDLQKLLHGLEADETSKVVDVLLSRIRQKVTSGLGRGVHLISNHRGRGWSLNPGALEHM